MGTTVSTGGITFNDATVLTTNPIPSGTVMLFVQTAAPTGWTKDVATHNNKALRVVTGTVTPGGSVAFTSAFTSQAVAGTVTVNNTTLTTPQIPSHTHTLGTLNTAGKTGIGSASGSASGTPQSSGATGGGGAHNHTGSFSGTAINLAVQYVDVIIATKDAYPAV